MGLEVDIGISQKMLTLSLLSAMLNWRLFFGEYEDT